MPAQVIRFPVARAMMRPPQPRGPAQVFVLPVVSFDDAVDLVANLIAAGHPIVSLEPLAVSR